MAAREVECVRRHSDLSFRRNSRDSGWRLCEEQEEELVDTPWVAVVVAVVVVVVFHHIIDRQGHGPCHHLLAAVAVLITTAFEENIKTAVQRRPMECNSSSSI